jgi:hypothetical protein
MEAFSKTSLGGREEPEEVHAELARATCGRIASNQISPTVQY